MQALLDDLVEKYRNAGADYSPATYIPELANVDSSLFSISVVTTDGDVFSSGDSDSSFSMQSMSKIVSLACAIDNFGRREVFSRVGMEPCAEPFNSIMKLEMEPNVPLNPFINSGAIVTCEMIADRYEDASIDHILLFAGRMAGRPKDRPMRINERIYHSEDSTADRNRSLAYFMRSTGALVHDVEETLDIYFRQCSISVTTADLAAIGATIANGGVNPVTGERVISLDTAYIMLGLMVTCGLYNESGEFAVGVGVPGKSGVSGGILCSAPGRMGVAVYSPPLDDRGNSVAGLVALSQLSRELKLRGI